MPHLRIFPSIVFAALASLAAAQTTCPGAPSGSGRAWQVDNGVLFKSSGLAVDADGAPNSYLVDGNGLSYTCDGVVAIVDGRRATPSSHPHDWQQLCRSAWAHAQETGDYSQIAIFGFLTDSHGPVVQKEGDPLPGKGYISTTTLTILNTPTNTQRHWVDATRIPYVVLTSSFARTYHVQNGDLAVVYRPRNASIAYAVFADVGGSLGEASVKLHNDIGNDPTITSGGVARAKRGLSDAVLTLVFPGKNIPGQLDSDAWNAAIKQQGEEALQAWGGIERLKACAGNR